MATRLAIREQQLATWTAIIQECRNSGMKTKAWLAENNISKDQYYYWFKQLRLAACRPLVLNQNCQLKLSQTQSLAKKFTTSIKESDLYAPQIRYSPNTGRNALCQ